MFEGNPTGDNWNQIELYHKACTLYTTEDKYTTYEIENTQTYERGNVAY